MDVAALASPHAPEPVHAPPKAMTVDVAEEEGELCVSPSHWACKRAAEPDEGYREDGRLNRGNNHGQDLPTSTRGQQVPRSKAPHAKNAWTVKLKDAAQRWMDDVKHRRTNRHGCILTPWWTQMTRGRVNSSARTGGSFSA